jgi:hypothetical protein
MKQKKNIAFYVESLLLTLFILIITATLVRMFATARSQAINARALTQTQQIAQNVTDTFYASDSMQEFSSLSGIELSLNSDIWQKQLQIDSFGNPSRDGIYYLDVSYQISSPNSTIGQFAQLHLIITAKSNNEPLIDVTCEKYLPLTAPAS